jgi:hypothetical protein
VTSFTSATTSCGLRTGLISLVALLLGACSGQGHPCVEYERTITHGIYGQAVYKQFQKPDTPLYDVKVTLSGSGGGSGAPIATEARTNEDGLYEIETPPGTSYYQLCSDFAAVGCFNSTVTSLVRLDLVIDEGQVYWDGSNFGECP